MSRFSPISEIITDQSIYEIIDCIYTIENHKILKVPKNYYYNNIINPIYKEKYNYSPSLSYYYNIVHQYNFENYLRKFHRSKNFKLIRRTFITQAFIKHLEKIQLNLDLYNQNQIKQLIKQWTNEIDLIKKKNEDQQIEKIKEFDNSLATINDINTLLTNNDQQPCIKVATSLVNLITNLDGPTQCILYYKLLSQANKNSVLQFINCNPEFINIIYQYIINQITS